MIAMSTFDGLATGLFFMTAVATFSYADWKRRYKSRRARQRIYAGNRTAGAWPSRPELDNVIPMVAHGPRDQRTA